MSDQQEAIRLIPIGAVELRLDMIANALGIPAATLDKLASGELVAVPLPNHTSIPAEQDPATGRRGLYLVYLPSNPAGIDALHAVWGAEKTARLAAAPEADSHE